ncbi:MAG: hypothetical protein QXZ59_06535 [Nitrososphaeria archaeon]
MTEKHKTSMNLGKEVWEEWIRFVVNKTGSTRTIGSETEKAMKEYMKKHSINSQKGNGE